MNVYTVQTNSARLDGFGFNVSVTVEQNGVTLAVIEREFPRGTCTATAMIDMLEIAEEWYPPLDFTADSEDSDSDSDSDSDDEDSDSDSDDEDSDSDDEDPVVDYNDGFEAGRWDARNDDKDEMLEGCSDAFKDGYFDGFNSWRNA